MLEEKAIILTSDDKIQCATYTDGGTLYELIDGFPEDCGSQIIPVFPEMTEGRKELEVNIYCNSEYVLSDSDKYDKINAVASLIAEREIRGEAVLLVNESAGEKRGFLSEENDNPEEEHISELWAVRNVLEGFINLNRKMIYECHKQFDGEKSLDTTEFLQTKTMLLNHQGVS